LYSHLHHIGDTCIASEEAEDWPAVAGRVFTFGFLPKGFFSRLTVRLLHFCKSRGLLVDIVISISSFVLV